tara:strand:+ start:870 stop:1586 length:717 start_codon:yes stop_codon:yes gene_type:complete
MGYFRTRFRAKKVQAALAKSPLVFSQWMETAFNEHGAEFKKDMVDRISAKWGTGNPGGQLSVRSGKLRRSLRYSTSKRKGAEIRSLKLLVRIGGGPVGKYIYMQEHGGVIKPKNGKYLTVPLPDNLTAAARPRYPSAKKLMLAGRTYLKVKPVGGGLRGLINRRAASKGKRNLDGAVVTLKRKNKALEKDLWVLRRSVKVPARLEFHRTWNQRKRRRNLTRRLDGAIDKAVAHILGGA